MNMDEEYTVESQVAPPVMRCPKCDGLLPSKLGELDCVLCDAEVRVDHPPTRRKWKEEKVACPECHKVLVAGVEDRPANLKCSSCATYFTLTAHVVKVEIRCPKCERKLRMNRRPGDRHIDCPACDTAFKVTF